GLQGRRVAGVARPSRPGLEEDPAETAEQAAGYGRCAAQLRQLRRHLSGPLPGGDAGPDLLRDRRDVAFRRRGTPLAGNELPQVAVDLGGILLLVLVEPEIYEGAGLLRAALVAEPGRRRRVDRRTEAGEKLDLLHLPFAHLGRVVFDDQRRGGGL